MRTVTWRGAAPRRAVVRALEDARFAIARGARAKPGEPAVVSTAARRVPAAADTAARWIWVTPTRVDLPRAAQAALQGAYATVALDAPNAVATLIARLEELSVPDPAIEPPPHIVLDSAASRATVAQVARVAPTSMPVLITGGIGPQPHRSFIEVFGDAPRDNRNGEVAGAPRRKVP